MTDYKAIPKGCTLICHDYPNVIWKRPDGSTAVGTYNDQPTQTMQEFTHEVDINNIMRNYSYNQLPIPAGYYTDLTELPDYQTMLDNVRKAEDAFMTLPAEVRKRFDGDPQALINFLKDDNNRAEAQKLGLIDIKPEPIPDPVLAELKVLNHNISKSKKSDL